MKRKFIQYARKALSNEILQDLVAVGGVVAVMSLQPAILAAAIPIAQELRDRHGVKKMKKKMDNGFGYLRRKGFIHVESCRGEIQIFITKAGEEHAREMEIFRRFSQLAIKTPQRWDGKWRVILFDVKTKERTKRNALRQTLRRMNCAYLQKSAWVHPFDCREEIEFLRDFFNFSIAEVRLITASHIEGEEKFCRIFKLNK